MNAIEATWMHETLEKLSLGQRVRVLERWAAFGCSAEKKLIKVFNFNDESRWAVMISDVGCDNDLLLAIVKVHR